MKKIIVIPLFLSLFIVYACKHQHGKDSSLLPSVKGEANHIVVVMNGSKWKGEPGNTIREFILENIPGLPSEETKFNYLFVPHSNFDQVYKRQRNILISKIGPDYKERVIVQHDMWAKSQLVITVMAPTPEAFIKLYKQKGDEINEIITTAELKRLTETYKSNPEQKVVEAIKKEHNILLDIPKGFKINIDTTDFVWLRNEYRDIIEGIIIYDYPYTDTNTFTQKYLVEKRNSYLKKYIEGEVDGSYMATEEKYELYSYEYNLNGGLFTKELRGLWKMKNGLAMGGPFVSISQYDKERKRIVTVEGFIFAPAHEKRNLLRRVEAIVYSLTYPEKDKNS